MAMRTLVSSAMLLSAVLGVPALGTAAQASIVAHPGTPQCDGEKKPPVAEPQCDGEKKPDTKPKS